MKKIALAFLSLIMTTSAFANIHINPDAVVSVIKKYVPADKVNTVIREYNANLKASNGAGIAANRLWNVCAAAGWNIKEPNGKQKCQTFVNELVKSGKVVFKEVCGDDKGKTGATERCVTDFKDVSVNIGPAIAIAKEYVLVKYNDNSLQCFNKHRWSWNDDYVKCVSKNSNTFYEFQFDSVEKSIDDSIKDGIQIAVCTIHGAPATTEKTNMTLTSSTYAGAATTAPAKYTHVGASCEADATKCKKINKSISKFGYLAEYKNNKCNISFETVSDPAELRTAFGIDNFVFCAGFQARNNQSTESHVKNYIAGKAGVTAAQVKCDAGFKTYTGPGCKVDAMINFKDDIKTCHVGGKAIDLVFDDINESWTTYTDAADQAMACIVSGGTFSGKRCIGLGEQQCNTLRAANIKSCPECEKVYWDAKTKSCVLPAGASAANLQKGVDIGIIVGGTVVAVGVTIATAPATIAAAAAAGGAVAAKAAATTIVVLTGIETVGAGIEITSQLKIDGIADDFLVESNKCENASCAKQLINQHLQRLARLMDDMITAEITAIDSEMARLIELVPTTDDWWVKSLKTNDGKTFLESANDNMWEPEQIWRAIGVGLQFAGTFAALGKWIVTKTPVFVKKLDKTSQILLKKAKIAKANMVDATRLTGADAEWYKLWQDYAPKNQTLTEFKAMTNGNLDEMKQMSKNWTSRSTARAKTQAQDRLNQLMDEYDIDAVPDNPEELTALYKQHPDLKTANEQLGKFDNVADNVDNYSTFDPEMSRDFRQYNKAQKELNDWWETEYNKELDRFVQNGGVRAEFNDSEQVQKLLDQYAAKDKAVQQLKPSQWDIAEKYSLKNVDNVVNERAREFADIVNNNPEIKLQMDRWDDLYDSERVSVAQQIMDAYSAKNGTPRADVLLDFNTTAGGYYKPGTNHIVLNPNEQLQSPDGMIEVLAHEHGHLIDNLSPNEGALGAQYSHYGDKIYSNKMEKGYRVALTEQSSYKIGPAASTDATGVLDLEYDLVKAERNLAIQESQKADVGDIATRVGAAIPAAATAGVVAAKTPIKEIIKDKKGTKEEQK